MERPATMWARLSSPQRMSLVLVATLAAAAVAGVAFFVRPEYWPLYGQLDAEEAARVVAKLESTGVPYRITGGGKTITVPRDQVYRTRLQMAAEGLPRGNAGFELFDRTTFGSSDLVQRVNYQRALQGELTRTIETLAEVRSARVHLSLPQERLFVDTTYAPSASVVLHLHGNATLSRRQIRGITHLVASSVEGLVPERVTVVDAQGRLLSSGQEDVGGLGTAQLAEREQIEAAIEHRLQTMLDQVLGPGRSIVRVSADVDFSRRKIREERFAPQGRVPRSEVSVEETYEGRGGPGGSAPSIPSYTTSPGSQGSQYRRRESGTTYESSRRIEDSTSAGGAIRRLSVAVLVDQKVPAAQITALRAAVAAAVGFDAARRDSVVVQPVALPDRPTLPAEAPADAPPRRSRLLLVAGAVLALIALAGLVGLVAARGRRPRIQTLQPTPLSAQQLAASAAGPPDDEERILEALRSKHQEQPQVAALRRQAQTVARDRPADAAQIVKSWLAGR